jgi:signal peptidase I
MGDEPNFERHGEKERHGEAGNSGSRGSGGTGGSGGSGGVKDTIESVLIALILAFVFRAFVVEAFVIPTGSMATTLLGAHMRVTCEDCGYEFTTNFSAPQTPGTDEIAIPKFATNRTYNFTCPNCGHKSARTSATSPDNDARSPSVHYGDRILVLKYAYLGLSPQRWDVIVFKSPLDQRIPGRPMSVPDFQQNYIKRLIGLPGEQIMIMDGDIYARKSDTQPWTVQTKPVHVQEAMWRVVTDNDFQPRGLARGFEPPYRRPWADVEGAAFALSADKREMTSDGRTATVRFDPSAAQRTFALTDYMAFNSTYPQEQRMERMGMADQYDSVLEPGGDVVADLQLRLYYERKGGEGPLRLTLSRWGRTFRAELLPRSARLIELVVLPGGGVGEKVLTTVETPEYRRAVRVEFENVDYRVTLRIDGKQVLASTPEQYSPDVEALLESYRARRQQPTPAVEVSAVAHGARIRHLSLWRDVYYINRSLGPGGGKSPPWGSPDEPMRLGEKEFFPLGDNSALSLDGRFWTYDVDLRQWEDLHADPGKVPERFLLGKAFFVYWPAGYRPADALPGVVPNFGRMRVIH